jgi:hypothetical protein
VVWLAPWLLTSAFGGQVGPLRDMTLFLAQEVFICTASGRTRTLFPFASNGSRNALPLGSGAAVLRITLRGRDPVVYAEGGRPGRGPRPPTKSRLLDP